MDGKEKLGRIMIIIVSSLMTASVICSTAVNILQFHYFEKEKVVELLVRFCFIVLLCFLLFKGYSWSKWLLTFYSIVYLVLSLADLITFYFGNKLLLFILSLYLFISYLMVTILLQKSKSIHAYMVSKRGNVSI